MNKAYVFENKTSKRISILLEPWGEDYYLEPNDIFELSYESKSNGYFHTVLEANWLSVFVEGDFDYPDQITVNQTLVECGYGRLS